MKEQYKNAEMELVKFCVEDVIATSNNHNEDIFWNPNYTESTVPTSPIATTPSPGDSEASGWY